MVSFIIPVYNGEKYIERCILSIINSMKCSFDYEVIIINDGSKDGTKEIIDRIQIENSVVKVVHQKNAGVSSARDTGIQVAAGDWIVFVDADDIVTADIVSLIATYGIQADWLVFSGKASGVNVLDISKTEEKVKVLTAILNQSEDSVLKNIHLNTVWSKAYKRDVIKANSISFDANVHHGEDMLYNIDYMSHCQSVCCIEKSVYTLCANDMSATQRYQKNCIQNDSAFLSLLKTRNIHENSYEMQETFYKIVLNGIWISIEQYFAHPDNKNTINDRVKELKEFLNSEPYRTCIKKCSIERKKIRKIAFNMLNFHMYSLVLNAAIIMRKPKRVKKDAMKQI